VGTFWWYVLSRGAEALLNRLIRRDQSSACNRPCWYWERLFRFADLANHDITSWTSVETSGAATKYYKDDDLKLTSPKSRGANDGNACMPIKWYLRDLI
jgi:hypothetical protein